MATAEPHPGKSPTVCTASRPDDGLRIVDSDVEARVATSLDGSLHDCSPLAFAGHLPAEDEDGEFAWSNP
jgi:hypothetical protein